MDRAYIIPVHEHVVGEITYRWPEYVEAMPRLGYSKYPGLEGIELLGRSYYGGEDRLLVIARLTQAEHDILKGLDGVLALSENIDQNLTQAAVTAAQTFFESANLPGDWLNTSYSYRTVLRIVLGIFRLSQRFNGYDEGGKLHVPSGSLARQLKDIPVLKRERLQRAASDFGINYLGLTGTNTVRDFLKLAGQHFRNYEFTLSSHAGTYRI